MGRTELWNRVEGELRRALSLARKDLSPAGARSADEFLHHNELGLAFDVIVVELLKCDHSPLPSLYDHLNRAASDMDLLNGDLWSSFAHRFASPPE